MADVPVWPQDHATDITVVADPVDWSTYRKCSGCLAEIGEPCRSRSGWIVGGRPDGVVTELEQPHVSRPLRTARGGAR